MSDYTYEEVKYQEDLDLVCSIRRSDGWDIPLDPDNTMYQEYLKWKDLQLLKNLASSMLKLLK